LDIAIRGRICYLNGRYEEALVSLNRAIELDPDEERYLYDRALVHRAIGRVEEAQADLAAAIRRARQRYANAPQTWRNTLDLALYYLAAGKFAEADRLYRGALSGGAPLHLIREAICALDDLFRVFPDHAQARAMRGLLQEHLQEAE
jgi:tetratricopeptide (TPR) repeat protein